MFLASVIISFLMCVFYRFKKERENYFFSKGIFLTLFCVWIIGVIAFLGTKFSYEMGIKLIAIYIVVLLPVLVPLGILISWKMAKKRSLFKAVRYFKYIFWISLIGGFTILYLQKSFIFAVKEIF